MEHSHDQSQGANTYRRNFQKWSLHKKAPRDKQIEKVQRFAKVKLEGQGYEDWLHEQSRSQIEFGIGAERNQIGWGYGLESDLRRRRGQNHNQDVSLEQDSLDMGEINPLSHTGRTATDDIYLTGETDEDVQ